MEKKGGRREKRTLVGNEVKTKRLQLSSLDFYLHFCYYWIFSRAIEAGPNLVVVGWLEH